MTHFHGTRTAADPNKAPTSDFSSIEYERSFGRRDHGLICCASLFAFDIREFF